LSIQSRPARQTSPVRSPNRPGPWCRSTRCPTTSRCGRSLPERRCARCRGRRRTRGEGRLRPSSSSCVNGGYHSRARRPALPQLVQGKATEVEGSRCFWVTAGQSAGCSQKSRRRTRARLRSLASCPHSKCISSDQNVKAGSRSRCPVRRAGRRKLRTCTCLGAGDRAEGRSDSATCSGAVG